MKFQNSLFLIVVIFAFFSCDSLEDKKGRFLLKGNEKLKENDPKSALGFYTEALELDSTYSDAYFNKAMSHLRLNQVEEAISDFTLAIKYQNSYGEAYFQRGLSYLDNGEFYKGREDVQWLTANDPENWKSHFLNCLVEEKLKNYTEALTSFEKAFELNPSNSDLLVNQATILYYQKEDVSAQKLIDQAEEINPSEPNLHNLRSMILFDLGNYAEALQSVEKAITLDNQQAYFYNNKGLYLLYLDQPEEGLDLINQSIQMDPKNPFALRNKGIYYVMKGDRISALQYLEELYKNYPEMDLLKEYMEKAQVL